jgi:hypothetical protein
MWQKLWARIGPYVTLQILVNFIKEEFSMIFAFISKVCGDMFTSWNGDVDPARLIPYILCGLFGIFFLWFTWLDTYWHHAFNSMAFSTGAVAIGAQFVAAAGGVRIKQSSEIPMPPELTDPADSASAPRKSMLRRVVRGAINGALNK